MKRLPRFDELLKTRLWNAIPDIETPVERRKAERLAGIRGLLTREQRRVVYALIRSTKQLLLLLLLAGCGDEHSPSGWTYPAAAGRCDYIGLETGICVAWDENTPSFGGFFVGDQATDGPHYEAAYQIASACMENNFGIVPQTGPVVRVVAAPIELQDGSNAIGIVDPMTGQITIYDFGRFVHESVHYILWRANGDADAAHQHDAFDHICAN